MTVDVLHLEASPGRRYTNEEATVHRQTSGSEVDTTHLASNDDVISLSHHIEYVPSMLREGLVDVVENPADAFWPDRPPVVPSILREVVGSGIDRAPVQALVMRTDQRTVLSNAHR